jgi:large subunit ribosomal protein L21
MYAIVKTGGKQYRVQQGQSLLVERLPVDDGGRVSLQPLLYVDGSDIVDQAEGLAHVTVEARVLAHERGPKLRVVKFKPKRGYKRRNGHRQELTRLEVIGIRFEGPGREAARDEAAADGSTEATSIEAPVGGAGSTEASVGQDASTEASGGEGGFAETSAGGEAGSAQTSAGGPGSTETSSSEATNGA